MPDTVVAHAGFGQPTADQPLIDTTAYGSGPDDSITDTTADRQGHVQRKTSHICTDLAT